MQSLQGSRTYTSRRELGIVEKIIEFKENSYVIKGNKAVVESLESNIQRLTGIDGYFKTLTGVAGVNENLSGVSMVMFDKTKYPPRDQEVLDSKITELLEKMNNRKIHVDNATLLRFEILDIVDAHIHIIDERISVTDHETKTQENNIKRAKAEEKAEANISKFLGEFAEGTEGIKIPEGQRGVILSLTFDNSQIQVDYFDRHKQIGQSLLLGIVPQGRKTEAGLRRVIEKFEELKDTEFSWHREEYSMGHGTYLESVNTQGKWDAEVYMEGLREVGFSFEIVYTYGGGETYIPFRGYKKSQEARTPEPPTGNTEISGTSEGVQVTHNEDRNGVEIKFSDIPSAETRSSLKANGFRWSRNQGVWYTKFTTEKFNFASNLGA